MVRAHVRYSVSRSNEHAAMNAHDKDAGGDRDDLQYVMEGSRGELARFVTALERAGINAHVRPKQDCAPGT